MEMMIHLESENGHYVAQVMGYPESRVEAASCEAALAAVGSSIRQRVDNGEIFLLSFPNESTRSPSLTRNDPKSIKSIDAEQYLDRFESSDYRCEKCCVAYSGN